MMHGGPDPAEILFKVRIRPANAPPEATVLASNKTNPDPKVKVEGPFKQYGVDLVPGSARGQLPRWMPTATTTARSRSGPSSTTRNGRQADHGEQPPAYGC